MEMLLVPVRAAIILVNSIIFFLGSRPDAPHYGEALVTTVAACAYAVALLAFRPYLRWPILTACLFTTFTDSLLIAVWVFQTGGPQSDFYLLYHVSVASIAVRYSLRESLTAAAAYSLSYAALVLALTPDPASMFVPLLIRISYMWFIAVIVGGLAREERNRSAEYAEIVGLHRDLEQTQAALRHQALHDALTGLPNRRRFDDRLHECVEIAQRSEQEVALLVLDLDQFKAVNDTLGHQAGDDLLRQVADRLRGTVRTGDLVARLGGDEFALVLPNVGPTEAAAAAERVLVVLRQPVALMGRSIDPRGSIGVALFPHDARDPAVLMQHADMAMYTAKRGQRGYARFRASTVHGDAVEAAA